MFGNCFNHRYINSYVTTYFQNAPMNLSPHIQVWLQLSSTERQHHSIIVRIFAYMQYSQSYVCYACPDIVPQIIGYNVIYKTDIQFWAVLGSGGCREKKIKTAISMLLFKSFFFMFS